MSVYKLLNDDLKLLELQKLISPYKVDSEKGSHIIASALNKWSQNQLPLAAWINKNIEYWGVHFKVCSSNYISGELKEQDIFLYPKSNEDSKNVFANNLTDGWPRYPHLKHSQSRHVNVKTEMSNSFLNRNQKIKIESVVDFLTNELGDFELLNTTQLVEDAKGLIDSKLYKNSHFTPNHANFFVVLPVLANNEYVSETRLLWNAKYPAWSNTKWPDKLSESELSDYICNSNNYPDSPGMVVANIRIYARRNKLDLNKLDWTNISKVFSNCEYKVPSKNVIKGIEQLPRLAQIAWLDSLLENSNLESPQVLEYIDNLKDPHFEKNIIFGPNLCNNPFANRRTNLLADIGYIRYQRTLPQNEVYLDNLNTRMISKIYGIISTGTAETVSTPVYVKDDSFDSQIYMLKNKFKKSSIRKAYVFQDVFNDLISNGVHNNNVSNVDKAYYAFKNMLRYTPPDEKSSVLKSMLPHIRLMEKSLKRYVEEQQQYGGYVQKEYTPDIFYNEAIPDVPLETFSLLYDDRWDILVEAWNHHYMQADIQMVELPSLEWNKNDNI